MSHDPKIEPLGGETPYDGSQFSVRVQRFRHADGEEVRREFVRRMPAAAIVAYDDEHVWLVRQPREAILQHTLELPAGKLDVAGESALQTAQRELAEEIGQEAERWEEVRCYYSSSGYSDELVHVFAATGLRPSGTEPTASERIEIVRWPLADLDAALAATNDAKTVIGLQWLRGAI
jgi:8-oxo-dGTP pyrophosphatase MutT (NUDIX family)